MNSLLIFIYLVAFTLDVFLLVFSATRKDHTKSIYFTVLTAGLAVYSMGCALLVSAGTRDAAVTALKIANAGIPLIAAFFLLIALALFQPDCLRGWMLYAALIYSFGIFFFVMFNDSHFLYYSAVEVTAGGELIIERGPVFWFTQVVNVLCMTPGYIIMLSKYIRGSAKIRTQMNYTMVGTAATFAANILNISGALQNELLDPTPVVLTVAISLFVINLNEYHIFDIAAIASNTALDIMSDAMIIVDKDWEVLFCNASAKKIFPDLCGCAENERVEKIRGWPSEFKGITAPCEKECLITDWETGGLYRYRADVNKIMRDRRQIGWYIMMHDITDMTFLIDQLQDLATNDPLTRVLNRRSFLERVDVEMDKSARINLTSALVMFDIDKFKNINDTHGHLAGDYILCSVVDTVKKQLRSYDIIARYGGEEFVIFTNCLEDESLNKFANRLREAVQDSVYIYAGKIIPTTASFGTVEIYPGDTFEQAMAAADEAMYKAKRDGRNQVASGEIIRKKTARL